MVALDVAKRMWHLEEESGQYFWRYGSGSGRSIREVVDRIENRATERIMSRQAVMGVSWLHVLCCNAKTEGKRELFVLTYLS
jgi:hypothetical protein